MPTEEEKAAAAAAEKAAADKVVADAAAEKAAADKVAADAIAAAKVAAADPDASEVAALKAELAAAKAAAAKFDGLDADAARAAIQNVADSEKARVAAEKDKAKAEGNFEKLRELQQAESEAAVKTAADMAEVAIKERDEARSELYRSKVETAFANSKFLQEDTILSGTKAQRLFGDHVEFEDGVTVVYDAPANAAKRARVMDAKGNPLPFNEAIAKIINADPDKDTLLKSKVKAGASSKTIDGKTKNDDSRHDRLKKGLQGLRRT